MASPPARPTRGSRLRTLVTWAIAFATLAWLFRVVPAGQLRLALARAPLVAFAGLAILYVVLVLAVDALATWATLRYTLRSVPVKYLEILMIRGASYLLAVIHYGAGQGGLAYFVHRRYDVPLARAAGAVLVNVGVNLILVTLCAGAGLALGGAPGSGHLRVVVLVLAAGFPAYLLVIALRPRFLAERNLLAPLFDAGVLGHLVATAARLPHMAVLIGGHFVAMRLFEIDVPLGSAMVLLPIVFVVAALPITPSGLGTAQATAIALLAPFAPGATLAERQAAVLAYSLSFHFAGLILDALVGVVFLRLVTRADRLEKIP